MWYIVLRRDVRPRGEWALGLDDHLRWMRAQHEAGTILFSGPSRDRAYGIYVVRAASRAAAEAVAAGDPFTAAGYTAFEIIEWEVHQVLGAGPFTAAALRGAPPPPAPPAVARRAAR